MKNRPLFRLKAKFCSDEIIWHLQKRWCYFFWRTIYLTYTKERALQLLKSAQKEHTYKKLLVQKFKTQQKIIYPEYSDLEGRLSLVEEKPISR